MKVIPKATRLYACLLMTALSSPLVASEIVWNGTTSNDMSSASNWLPTTVPGAADDAIFQCDCYIISCNKSTIHFNLGALTMAYGIATYTITAINPNVCHVEIEVISSYKIIGYPKLKIGVISDNISRGVV